eukprot:3331117-Rhodomonas_salina.1
MQQHAPHSPRHFGPTDALPELTFASFLLSITSPKRPWYKHTAKSNGRNRAPGTDWTERAGARDQKDLSSASKGFDSAQLTNL